MNQKESFEIGLWYAYSTDRDKTRSEGVPFTLSFKEYEKLARRPCRFCKTPGQRKVTDHQKISRLYPLIISKGFVPGNIVQACHICASINKQLQISRLNQTIKICRVLQNAVKKSKKATK